MKKSILVLSLALVLFQSCDKEQPIPNCENCNFTCLDSNETDVLTNDCINEWECIFKITPQSKVAPNEYPGLANGDKNVFQMIRSTEGNLQVIDDEFTHVLVFELDESQNSFSVQDNELKGMKTHYGIFCYCLEAEFKAVSSGCMEGEKQSDGTWLVQGHLTVPYSSGDIETKFEAQFVN